MRKFLKRLFSRKSLVRFAFFLAALGSSIVLFYSVERWLGKRAWNAYKLRAEQQGIKLSFSEFVPPPVPDSENYAAVPFIELLFQLKKIGAREPVLFPEFSVKGKQPPKFGSPSNGGKTDLKKWRDYFVIAKLIPNPSEQESTDLLRLISEHAKVLEELRESSSRSKSRFPVDYAKGFRADLPHLAQLYKASRFFHLSAVANLAAGKPHEAASEIEQLFRMHTALRTEPGLISGLISRFVLEDALGGIWEGLALSQWSDSDLEEFERKLSEINVLAEFRFYMNSEKGSVNSEFERFDHATPEEIAGLYFGHQGRGLNLPVSLYPRGWWWQNAVEINEFADQFLARYMPVGGQEPEKIVPSPEIDDEWLANKFGDSFLSNSYHLLARSMIKGWGATAERGFLGNHIRIGQARLGCALLKFHRQHGTYPEHLDALTPQYLTGIPKDIFDGQRMRYRRSDSGGYILWSVGRNGRDDGGKAGSEDEPLDSVWCMPGK